MSGTAREPDSRVRIRLQIDGGADGVDVRRYVHELATTLDLTGSVSADAGVAVVEAEGEPGALEAFVAGLAAELPRVAISEQVVDRAVGAHGPPDPVAGGALAPDLATCAACRDELTDPRSRRFRYPFTSCAGCGPRYALGGAARTDTMCAACAGEYDDPRDRRYRAPWLSCPSCGPRLHLVSAGGRALDGDPIDTAGQLLRDGFVVAIEGIGGYRVAVDAVDERSVSLLRARKRRDETPFAVMVADLDAARELCTVTEGEATLLTSPEAPVVLLRRTGGVLAPGVAPGSRVLGVMLPHTPLQQLLVAAHGGPLVLTGSGHSGEPIVAGPRDMNVRAIADAVLTDGRPVQSPVGDSVVRVVHDRLVPLHRARGYAPRPIPGAWDVPRPVLAVGARHASTVCIAADRHAVLSQPLGDLDTGEALASFTAVIERLSHRADVTPAVVAHDLHPEYLSTRYAHDLPDVDLVGVQHHHAHVAACLADHGMAAPAIGVVFDGGGHGDDGTIWGGEILVADLERCTRVGHLEAVPQPGGAAAVREPWRMAGSYLHAALGEQIPEDLAVRLRHRDRWSLMLSVVASGVNAPLTSGAGRLFDAVAALVGVRDTVRYHGQAAMELEHMCDPRQRAGYRAGIVDTEPFVIRSTDLIRAIVADLRTGTEVPTIAARFHAGVAGAIADACQRTRAQWGLGTVALSGDAFGNAVLVERTVARLEAEGFHVLTHVHVPPGDGGISFGQAAVAAARDRAGLR